MKRIMVLLLLVVAAFGLAACQEETVVADTTATAYSTVHGGHYVGEITVVVDGKGVVKSASIEEWFLPYNWAKVAQDDANANVLAAVGSRGTSYYSKFIRVGDMVFTGTVLGTVEAKDQHVVYASSTIANLDEYVDDQVNGLWYVTKIKAGNFGLCNEDGTTSTLVRTDATSNKAMNKSQSGYWKGESYPLGWAGNTEAVVNAIVGTKMEATAEDLVKDETSLVWSVSDVVTGATMTDFPDYYLLAKAAYNLATTPANAATAYATVHGGHYVGEITVTVDNKGVVTAATIEEWFLPYNWAKVAQDDANANVLAAVGSRGTSYYSKYVRVGDIVFTGTVLGTVEAKDQHVVYASSTIANLDEYVDNQVNGLWYVNMIKAGNFGLCNADGTTSTLVRTDATSNKAMNKSLSGYWTGSSYPLGWAGNTAAVVAAIVGTKMEATAEDLVKDETSLVWSVSDVVTGATMTDFPDYYLLAQAAYNLIVK